METRLGRIWAELLGLDAVGVHRDLFELGADSILVIQAVSRAQQAGIRVTAQAHFAHSTLASLAAVATESSPARASRELVAGRAELSPIQRWFFAQPLESPQHYNQSHLMEVPATLEPRIIEAALAVLLEHHDALRLSFFRVEDGWEALHAAPPLSTRVGSTSLQNMPPAEQRTLFESVATGLQGSFELSHPPLLRAHLFRYGADRPSRLLLIAHHLVIDAVSWGIVLQDLCSVCGQLEAGQTVRLPDKTSSFQDWTQRLKTFAASNVPDRDYWDARAARIHPSFADISPGTLGSADNVVLRFDESLTRTVLQDTQRSRGVQINNLLLTALWLAFRDWRGLTELFVELEGHGREEIFDDLDVSRTVGWFTTHYPVLLSAASAATPAEALRGIGDRLREIPMRGLGYGLTRTGNHSAASVRFNYLGQMDRVLPAQVAWKPLLEHLGQEHSPGTPRAHLFEVDGMIFEGCLQLTWTYNRNACERGAIEQLSGLYASHLGQLVHPQSAVDRGFTPEDFPAARIDKTALAALLGRIQG
jgi:non-ribosomal peptide synthase protein (TIGR01720 family)